MKREKRKRAKYSYFDRDFNLPCVYANGSEKSVDKSPTDGYDGYGNGFSTAFRKDRDR